uniref:Probable 6-phosphogluconolactonase n=1 Tax=Kalanchoe fedtschenkoi TaxID=63787 RepID=A0A7N0T142_KALFE
MTSINDGVCAEGAADDYTFAIRQLMRTRVVDVCDTCDCPKFDLILLGMGPDGHVASLFPNHPALKESDDWITFIVDSPESPPERITFTLPVINSAANVAIVAAGSSKADAALQAIEGKADDGPPLPAGLVRPSSGKLVWFLDSEAASKLGNYKFCD